jgi:hypothetical protein
MGESMAGSTGTAPNGQSAIEGGNEVASGAADSSGRPGPTLDNGRYVFKAGDLELEVDPAIGGRVTRFSLSGTNILTGPEVVAAGEDTLPNMYGSTFWTSPQSDWGWPPEAPLDADAHAATLDGAVLSLQSQAGATTGYAVQKRFWADASRSLMRIEYVLQNRRATLPAAPWEISRVPKEGLVFFAAGDAPGAQSTLASQSIDGVTWVDIAEAPAQDSKLFQDGAEGWLAYAYRDLVFIKVFDDVSPGDQAAGEAEIEVFINGTFDYVEIEQQGRYGLVPAGAASTWRVGWLLRQRPVELPASIGNAALVAWVREQVALAR